jgi:hypothetical protein
MRELIGGCLCGQIRYSAQADPAIMAVCHCRNCQKQAGTAFAVVIGIPKSALTIEGELKTYHDTGESGQAVDRNFCPNCGSPITSNAAVLPELVIIKAGTLDDTSWLNPTMHVYCDSAQAWTSIPQDATKFGRGPG